MRSAEGFISAPGIIALCRDWRLAPRQGNLHFPCDSLRCLPFCVPHESEHLALQAIHFHGVLLTVSGGDTIAIYHCSIKIVSRGKGKSAVAAAAYRAGEKLTNEWDGLTHDYTRKGGVVHSEIMLPPHAPPSLSFLCLFKKEWQKQSYLSLGGVSEKALLRFLSDRPNIKTVYLCLDSDKAGTDACSRLNSIIPQGYTVNRLVPLFKDWNEVLQRKEEITDGKYLREAVYGLREPQQEETVEIIRMSEVDTQTVEWLWEPYIPFGKVTIVQGNPGEGKTTLALRLCAACTNRKPFPAMAEHEPFNVIYQTAEDGLGDTVKPRLMEADADLDRVLVIDEGKQELSLSDERIERAIRQTGARLIILDPIQAYVGEKTDMNKANEIRPIFRRLAEVAERTGCAVVLIGHLNKAAGGQSAYRGLGSIDFRAAARSVLLIGRVKREPNVRVIIHDKSSLAPEGKPMAFSLGAESGFSWIGEYDITADELLSGTGGNTETKTEQAERLILDLLADGKEMASEDIVKAAAEAGISERTVQNAKRSMGGILGARRVGSQWYNFIKKKQPPETAK